MGNTTIIELDHDRCSDIFYNDISQKRFLEQIQEQLASFKHTGKEILGGKVLDGFHRSGKHYDDYIAIKKIMGWTTY